MRHESNGDTIEVLAVVKNSGAKNKDAKKKTVSSKQKVKKDLKDIKCFKCHEQGHYARDCPQKKQSGDERGGGSPQQYVLVVATNESGSTTREKRVGISAEQVKRLLKVNKTDAWLDDSGASRHISHRREWFETLRTGVGGTVMLGNDVECKIEGEGNINLKAFVDGRWNRVRIEGVLYILYVLYVLYIPQIKKNLLSMGACAERGCFIGFDNEHVTVSRKDEVTSVNQGNAIYRMLVRVVPPKETMEINVSTI